MPINMPIRFGYIPYPLWRRKMPALLATLIRPLLRKHYPLTADTHPPTTPAQMAQFMARWELLNGAVDAAQQHIESQALTVETVADNADSSREPHGLIRLPAQWETMDSVLLSWPVMYPPLWALHAQMVAAIVPVAGVVITAPHPMWARGIDCYLAQHGIATNDRVRYLHLPTDDIWIRDYGPFVGYDEAGQRAVVYTRYDPLPAYPQQQDDAMPRRWAAHEGLPARYLDLHTEGGNLWTDGAGTFIMSEQIFRSNPQLTHDRLLEMLHEVFAFEKLILLPRLKMEETGHIDLLIKLADAETVLVSAPSSRFNGDNLRNAADRLRRETNAHGQSYRVIELPTPPFYFNWTYKIWRSYTNALTVNERVLVPVFGIATDDDALDIYREALPAYEICPIDCRIGANGGGAVHCMTKEIPSQI